MTINSVLSHAGKSKGVPETFLGFGVKEHLERVVDFGGSVVQEKLRLERLG